MATRAARRGPACVLECGTARLTRLWPRGLPGMLRVEHIYARAGPQPDGTYRMICYDRRHRPFRTPPPNPDRDGRRCAMTRATYTSFTSTSRSATAATTAATARSTTGGSPRVRDF